MEVGRGRGLTKRREKKKWAKKKTKDKWGNRSLSFDLCSAEKGMVPVFAGDERYMQAVVDELVLGNVDPLKHPSSWNLDELLKDFVAVSGKILDESCTGITVESLMRSLANVNESSDNELCLPNLPQPLNAFRGIRKRTSSLKRWLAICSDDSLKDGRYRVTANLLRKYLGDLLIASYTNTIQESGYAEEYVKEIERAVLVKSLDCFWRDHLVNMNRLNSAVNVRSFGHRDPLEEYKIDGCRFFISMLSATRRLTVESLLRYWSSPMESQELYAS
ncbi:SecA Wing/Scaffold [Cynara cardunculus var. scolymus]|uniref:SecA Wing/Scaffold n=1 Tax=Cynara cardunculus var. scolymus TaxID=59895 RepID=A0A103XNM8_CYNCS|nr:SecA Wing/Scaffold [Cynara cardunculus var. scolymus]